MREHRAPLLTILAIGIAMIILPFAIGLPSKASAGQKMIDSFHPIMQPASVKRTIAYYNTTFVPLRAVATGAIQAGGEAPKLIGALAGPLHMTPAGVQQFLGRDFPAMAGLLGSLPQLAPTFAGVPGGLDHYKPLVETMRANVSNYAKIDSLPNFSLFTWFFLVPGVLLVLLAGWPLLAGRRRTQGRAPIAAT
ncbi:MAG: hypothetical protein ACYC91_06800 [Solirubrobacteraceae bacterium]